MQDINSMNKEMQEILATTKLKLGILLSKQFLQEINQSLLYHSQTNKIYPVMENCCKEYFRNYMKVNEINFENAKTIFNQYMILLIEIIENCASILHSLFIVKYPQFVKKRQKESKNPIKDKSLQKSKKIKITNIFPTSLNSQLLNSLFNNESKIFLGLILLGTYCSLSSGYLIKIQAEFKTVFNVS